ncbi:hypothetical protein HGRIS_004837 [Hohenbuehelia grisea]|uniref:non-specific serine/threonine protein kinase n=1 Tax=Hohenbuehelia grisea TaxID=104357 RepID=A0ABR3JDK1_9AGAR
MPNETPRLPRKPEDPKRIGLWKIGRTIGKGSSGRVRIARHAKTGQYAAIKIVSKAGFSSLQGIDERPGQERLAIEREIVVMKLIDHPNIMKLYDVWETSTELYLILEYVQGGELFDYLCETGRLPTLEALDYFQQIIMAVDYCHRLNVAHRDLKPENILLDQDHNVKIADFGMAAWQANSATNGLLETSCGSPHYVAPEVCSGMSYNGSASDIWSCGIILFALLVGKLPFDAEDLEPLIEKVKLGIYKMPADIDPLAQNLISRMLKVDTKMRITMPEILDHPFFKLKQPRVPFADLPNMDLSLQPIRSVASIDDDVFANLRTLWNGTPDEEIVTSLTNDEQNWQKGIYRLLMEYRNKRSEDYDEEAEAVASQKRKAARKVAQAQAAPQVEPESMTPSPSTLPPRAAPPTPSRARSGGNSNCPIEDSLEGIHVTPSINVQAASPSPMTPISPSSPIWNALNLPPLTAVQLQDEKIQQFFHQIAHRINVIQRPASLADEHSPGPKDGPHGTAQKSQGLGILDNSTKPLTIRQKPRPPRPTVNIDLADKENFAGPSSLAERRDVAKKSPLMRRLTLSNDAKRTQMTESKERDRCKLKKKRSNAPVSPGGSDGSSLFTLPPPSPATPFLPASPVRNWFGNVLKIRPATHTLFSLYDVQTTRNECRRLLMGMEVQVVLEDSEGPGILRCRLEEARDPSGFMTVKAVRFRVNVQPYTGSEADYILALVLVQEKGSAESFREICNRLRRDWVLDVKGASPPRAVLPSPTLGAQSMLEV